MQYITRNANVILLFLILLSAVSLVGATVYFQDRFDMMNREYNTKRAQLENVSSQLEQYAGLLSTTKVELELKGSREEELTAKFTDIKSEKQSLEEERDSLINQKNELSATLSSTQNQLSSAQSSIVAKDASIASLTTRLAETTAIVSARNARIDDLEEQIDCLRATADGSEANC